MPRIFDSSKTITRTASKMADAGAPGRSFDFYSRQKNLDPHLGPYQNEVLTTDELKAIEDAGGYRSPPSSSISAGGSGRTFHDDKKKINDVAEALALCRLDEAARAQHALFRSGTFR